MYNIPVRQAQAFQPKNQANRRTQRAARHINRLLFIYTPEAMDAADLAECGASMPAEAEDAVANAKTTEIALEALREHQSRAADAARAYSDAIARDRARQMAAKLAQTRAARRLPRIGSSASRAKGLRPVRAQRREAGASSGSAGDSDDGGGGDGEGSSGPDAIAVAAREFRLTTYRASRVAWSRLPVERPERGATACLVSTKVSRAFLHAADVPFVQRYEGWKPSSAFHAIAYPARRKFLSAVRKAGASAEVREDVREALWAYDHLRTDARQHADRMPAYWETWSGSLGENGDR